MSDFWTMETMHNGVVHSWLRVCQLHYSEHCEYPVLHNDISRDIDGPQQHRHTHTRMHAHRHTYTNTHQCPRRILLLFWHLWLQHYRIWKRKQCPLPCANKNILCRYHCASEAFVVKEQMSLMSLTHQIVFFFMFHSELYVGHCPHW